MTTPKHLPADFDVAIVGDDSKLPAEALAALRELVWRKCKAEPLWFLTNFWWVMDPKTFRWSPFRLRDYQVEDGHWFVQAMRTNENTRKLIYKARQIGWTTLASALAAHDCLTQNDHPWLISSGRLLDAQDTLSTKIKQPFARLPLWMRNYPDFPRIVDDNQERMTLSNGSSILSVPSTSTAGRSRAVYGTLIDEWAFVEDAAELLGALNNLTYGPLIVFSSANGMGNPFHALWLESQSHDSAWDARFHPWSVVPDRDEKWYERTKREFRGMEWLFYQENPATPEEGFAKSGRTVIPIDILRESGYLIPPTWKIDLGLMSRAFPLTLEGIDANATTSDGASDELWVFAAPIVERDDRGRVTRKPNYVLGCDVAEGLEHGDRTSINIFDANSGEQVVAYRGHWPIDDLHTLIEWLAISYHHALVLVERNNHGMVPLFALSQRGYPRLYRMAGLAQIQMGDRTPRYGFITTSGSKPKLVNDLIRAIRDDHIVIHDIRFMQEAQTFVADGKGGYAASSGSHDDHVMGVGLAWQGVLEVGSYPIIFYDDAPAPIRFSDLANLKPKKVSALDQGIGNTARRNQPNAFVI